MNRMHIPTLDHFFLICHPVWSHHHHTVPWARRLFTGVWPVSVILGAAYLAFRHVHLVFVAVRFLFPFCIITGCYYGMGQEIKKRKLVRTRKPFQIPVAAVMSFFVFWLAYHLKLCYLLHGFNFCFTPILYLLVGEKFQQVSKTSIFALLKRGFMDIPVIPMGNANEECHRTYSRTKLTMTQCNDLPFP
ncbi:PREDICTED: probable G-protein coupled receptor 33 [Gekko japonicus]|uniref:Probable G-protein coupled receptor 33 n=1 Tax=Gekko japonicus TaxID=146911 RepID=A0ABM1LBI5_GEKJA|nr:PREDICTED: probable G-protein coupled receptor 33 [Gekko japonicus]